MKIPSHLFVVILLTFSGLLSADGITLDQAVESSLMKNEMVSQSQSQVRQAQESVNQLRGAIFPNLSINGSYLMQPKPSDPVAAAFFPEYQGTANFTLTQPLFRGFREFAAVRRQNDLLAAQRQMHRTRMTELYQTVAESFIEVLALEQDLRNIEEQQKIYQTRVRDLQGRTRRGESSASEGLTAQSTAAALDAEYQIQKSKLISARENFAYLTGLSSDTALTDRSDDVIPAVEPLEYYLSRLEERPDIKVLKEQAAASDEDVSIAKGAHWPTADFVGNYYLIRPDGFMKDLKWDAQFRVSLPLFEGGVTQSRIRSAVLQRQETDLTLAQTRRKAASEIKALHQSLKMRADQLKYLKQSSDLSQRNYQTLLSESRRGLLRSIDVQLGLTEYRLARRTYDQARYQARLERIRIDLATANVPSILKWEMP